MAKKANEKSTSSLTRGKHLGKYRLEKHLAEGGSSEVWKARDCVEGIWVALKIPHTDINGVRDNQALFREIRMVTKLRHRHIMPVKNADIIEGHVVLATELSVRTLADCSAPMSVRRIFSIITQVLDGLAYAHRNRLVHCDVSPGNIFLFPNGRAALGDFGISIHRKGRMKTVDDFGTPGYVSPEQAYGRPSYPSDCFAVALIIYEYITGILPRWPFRWPLKAHNRFKNKTSASMLKFIKKALAVDPVKRFANAEQMSAALQETIPKSVQKKLSPWARGPQTIRKRKADWRNLRRKVFSDKYGKIFHPLLKCTDCGEPIAESMSICPWCGSENNRFQERSSFAYLCPRCDRGILPEWRFCPWCYGAGFEKPAKKRTKGIRYHGQCKSCKGKIMRFMRYCPWCRRKIRTNWRHNSFPEICAKCGWSVDSSFWNYCPWCKQRLI